ncbi:MAG: hypothetical protein Salg2KO_10270 [Salibacteraceae bacterium]
MPQRYTRNLDNHDDWSLKVKELQTQMNDVKHSIAPNYPLQSKVNSLLNKMANALLQLKSELDTDYHSLISDETFMKRGHIYY